MLPDRLLPHTVTIQTPGTRTDRYGDTVQDWTDPTEATVKARVEMVMTQNPNEVTNGRDDVASVWRIFTNAEISKENRIVWGTRAFDVDGDVSPATGRSLSHYEAILKAR